MSMFCRSHPQNKNYFCCTQNTAKDLPPPSRNKHLQISAAAEEQHSVAEEINRHIQQIYDEARLVESLAHSAQDDSGRLAGLSDELNALVGRFKS